MTWFDATVLTRRAREQVQNLRPLAEVHPAFDATPIDSHHGFAPCTTRSANTCAHLSLEKHASALTVKSYREDLTQAVEYFTSQVAGGQLAPARLTPRLVRSYSAWLSTQNYARTTIARRLAAVRSWCRFLCIRGPLDRNPADGLRTPARKALAALHGRGRYRQTRRRPDRDPARRRPGHVRIALLRGLRVSELVGLNSTISISTTAWSLSAAKASRAARPARRTRPQSDPELARGDMPPSSAIAKSRRSSSIASAAGSRPARSPGCWKSTSPRPGSIAAAARTRSATVSPRICSTPAPTSAACRNCSATRVWAPRKFTPT